MFHLFRNRMVPHPHQGMLQQGQLIMVYAQIVQECVHRLGLYIAAANHGRAHNRLSVLFTCKPRRKKLVVVQYLGKAVEKRTFAHRLLIQ